MFQEQLVEQKTMKKQPDVSNSTDSILFFSFAAIIGFLVFSTINSALKNNYSISLTINDNFSLLLDNYEKNKKE